MDFWQDHHDAIQSLDRVLLRDWGTRLADALLSGKKLLAAGNGGSAAEAQHLTSELVGRFSRDRRALPAIALHADTSSLTALGNDYGYDKCFSRQVEAHGKPGDILVLLSTSGESSNLIEAAKSARRQGMEVWAMLGAPSSPLEALAHSSLNVHAASSRSVQEAHLFAVHAICSVVDEFVFAEQTQEPDNEDTPHITIVGDVFLDRDISGAVERISPEAPVPVLTVKETSERPGGAGLAAMVARELGARVTLVAAFARDEEGTRLRSILERNGVQVLDLGTESRTAIKIRHRSKNQTLLMVDNSPAMSQPLDLTDEAKALIAASDQILVSDYARGVCSNSEVRTALNNCDAQIVWDPHTRGTDPVANTLVCTPNQAESKARRNPWPSRAVAETLGDQGVKFHSASESEVFTVSAINASDTCGAGDCFAAALCIELSKGESLRDATRAAAVTASVFVDNGGASAIGRTGRVGFANINNANTNKQWAETLRRAKKKLIATGGCFDLLHVGHLSLLTKARAMGDALVVFINSDRSVEKLKGNTRPLVPAEERKAMLEALSCVDRVIIFDASSPAGLIEELQPDVFVKGGDYELADLLELEHVNSYGGKVELVDFVDGKSTSKLIAQAQQTNCAAS